MASLVQNPGDLSLLSQYVAEACCIHLGEEKGYLFEARLGVIIAQSGAANIPEFIRLARADPTGKLRDRIVDAMTTHETYWFRDERPWAALRQHLLPRLAATLRTRPRIRILCAACSTGQEPYSLAMMIDQLCSQGKLPGARPEQFEIIGTDVSAGTLLLAGNGRYNQIEIIRGLGEEWRKNYFTQAGPIWTISEPVRKRIAFKRHNLQDDLKPFGQFDLLFCRNVAIYFQAEFKQRLFQRLAAALNPGGHLLLGGSESLLGHQDLFASETIGEAIFYRRKP
ncbi:MAG: protein-glutamate O-methyltransferase CheR [Verrucomicrobia bacterium]|nr:protein-glutamate O-methyltransferase CheR [Verrucomicrobiota bacterium]